MASYKGLSVKKDFQHYLDKEGIDYADGATNDELVEILEANDVEVDGSHEEETEDEETTEDESEESSGADTLIWLKGKTIIREEDDDTPVYLDSGVYEMEPTDRTDNLRDKYCEVFENGDVKATKLAEIARWAGVNPDGKGNDELLDSLVQEPDPYTYNR